MLACLPFKGLSYGLLCFFGLFSTTVDSIKIVSNSALFFFLKSVLNRLAFSSQMPV